MPLFRVGAWVVNVSRTPGEAGRLYRVAARFEEETGVLYRHNNHGEVVLGVEFAVRGITYLTYWHHTCLQPVRGVPRSWAAE